MRILTAFLILAGVGVAPVASADGSFAIGVDSALGFGVEPDESLILTAHTPGLSVAYSITENIAVQGIFGISVAGGRDDGPDVLFTRWGLALRGIYSLALTDTVKLGIPAGLAIVALRANPDGGELNIRRVFTVEAGLRPEWFIHPRLSLFTSLGFAFVIADFDTSRAMGATERSLAFSLFGNASLLGTAGFHLWF